MSASAALPNSSHVQPDEATATTVLLAVVAGAAAPAPAAQAVAHATEGEVARMGLQLLHKQHVSTGEPAAMQQ